MDAWLASLRGVVGDESVSPGVAPLAGVVPRLVAEPRDVDSVRAVLAWAFEQGAAVVPVGGATKCAWGRRPERIDIALSTRRLDAVLEHRAADLTTTVQAGASLDSVNRTLGERDQWIPLDPPQPERATIGGILACDASGPRRHRYGAPRDVLIGIAFVTAEGTLARAGGRVVKNVAGYDLGKLLSGSHGSLGVIVEATFKLTPRAAASRTVELTVADPERLADVTQAVACSQLAPTTIDIDWPPPRALVRFESLEASVDAQADAAVRLAGEHGASGRILSGAAEEACWRDRAVWLRCPDSAVGGAVRADATGSSSEEAGATDCVLNVGLPPASLGRELRWLADSIPDLGLTADVTGRAAIGTLSLRLTGPLDGQAEAIRRLHDRRVADGGHAVLVRGTEALRGKVEPWGPMGDAIPVMQAIKREFDPKGLLSPGRWPFD